MKDYIVRATAANNQSVCCDNKRCCGDCKTGPQYKPGCNGGTRTTVDRGSHDGNHDEKRKGSADDPD